MGHSRPNTQTPPTGKLDGVAGSLSGYTKPARCSPDPLQPQLHCQQCGAPLLHAAVRGRPKKFCSNRCRQAEFRYRRHLGAREPASPPYGASTPLLERVRANLPYIDIVGGNRRGSIDPDLRRAILRAEVESAT